MRDGHLALGKDRIDSEGCKDGSASRNLLARFQLGECERMVLAWRFVVLTKLGVTLKFCEFSDEHLISISDCDTS